MTIYEEIYSGTILFAISFPFWLVLHKILYNATVNILKKKNKDLIENSGTIATALVSIFQGLLSSYCGILIIWNCHHNIMWSTHYLTTKYGFIAHSYFIYDSWAMYVNSAHSNSDAPFISKLLKVIRSRPTIFFHHFSMVMIFSPILIYRYGIGDFFVGCFYCLELSTPFTNLRIILTKLGLKSTRLYALNGIGMVLSFFICRILVFPIMYNAYGYQHNMNLIEVVQHIPIKCNIGCLLILSLQVYWFILMTFGAYKLIKGYSKQKAA